MNEDEAAIIIQRRFRRYLEENRTRTKTSPLVRVDQNCNKLLDDEKLQAKRVLEEVNLFYRKLYSNLKKKEELRKLCANIDEISSTLKAIKKLEQCKELETSFCDSRVVEEINENHKEQIRRCNLKWWEKLDIYENV